MNRRWFWPLIFVATLLLSLAGASVWSVVVFYEADPRFPKETWVAFHHVTIDRAWYIFAALAAAAGGLVLALAYRLR
jgi:hypothetical protein